MAAVVGEATGDVLCAWSLYSPEPTRSPNGCVAAERLARVRT